MLLAQILPRAYSYQIEGKHHAKTALTLAAVALVSGANANAAPATQFKESFDGVGHMLIVPYYTVQSGNATLLNIINTDKVNGKAVKVSVPGRVKRRRCFQLHAVSAPSDVGCRNQSEPDHGPRAAANGRPLLHLAQPGECGLQYRPHQPWRTSRTKREKVTSTSSPWPMWCLAQRYSPPSNM